MIEPHPRTVKKTRLFYLPYYKIRFLSISRYFRAQRQL